MATTWPARFRAIEQLRWGPRRQRLWFDLYAQYLESPEWRTLRARVIERDERCRRCFLPGEVVHHLTYERIGAERLGDLFFLCTSCHEEAHRTKARLRRRA